MSEDGIATSPPHEDDGAPTSYQAEQSPSRRNSFHTADTQQPSRQATQELKSPSIVGSDDHPEGEHDGEPAAEAAEEPAAQPAQQLKGVVSKEYDVREVKTPEAQVSPAQPLGSSKDPLEDYAWEDLEQRFAAKMEECRKNEEALGQEFSEWLKVCPLLLCPETSRNFMCYFLHGHPKP